MTSTAVKRQRKAAGLCTDCGKPAVPIRSRCLRHLSNNTRAVQKNKDKNLKRWIEERRCVNCNKPLTELDEGHVRCLNCREKTFQWR